MFEKLQQLKQIRELQKALEKERAQGEKNGVKITISGSFEVISVKLNADLSLEDQEKALQEAFNQARGQMQQTLASRFGGQMGI